MSKIKRIIIATRKIQKHMDALGILPEEPFGFRHATKQQVLLFVAYASDTLNLIPRIIFLDEAMAFDRICYKELMYKLGQMGYLKNDTQLISIIPNRTNIQSEFWQRICHLPTTAVGESSGVLTTGILYIHCRHPEAELTSWQVIYIVLRQKDRPNIDYVWKRSKKVKATHTWRVTYFKHCKVHETRNWQFFLEFGCDVSDVNVGLNSGIIRILEKRLDTLLQCNLDICIDTLSFLLTLFVQTRNLCRE